MKQQSALTWLIPLIVILAFISAGAGLFWETGGTTFTFITLHGQSVYIDGRGLYRNDTLFSAATFRATDVITFVVGIPLLVFAFVFYRRSTLQGGVLLSSALTYFIYVGVSMTFGAIFNSLFLVYAALFSASLFAFITILMTIDTRELSASLSPGLPRKGMAIFMFVAGMGVLFIWLSDLIGPLMAGQAPKLLGPYTTMFTYGFDMSVIAPAAILTGIFLLRRNPLGDLFAAPMLILCALNGAVVIASTIAQTLAGIVFPMGVYIGMVGSWVVLGVFAIWYAVAFFRNLSDSTTRQDFPMRELDETQATEITATWNLLNPP